MRSAIIPGAGAIDKTTTNVEADTVCLEVNLVELLRCAFQESEEKKNQRNLASKAWS